MPTPMGNKSVINLTNRSKSPNRMINVIPAKKYDIKPKKNSKARPKTPNPRNRVNKMKVLLKVVARHARINKALRDELRLHRVDDLIKPANK